MPKTLAFEVSPIAHGDRIGPILKGLDILWSLGSLWTGRGWIWGFVNGIRTPLVKGLVPGKGLCVLRFRGCLNFFCCLTL